VSGLGRKAFFTLVTLIMLTISVYFEVSVGYVISFICLVITSLCIQGFRKKLIISSAATMLTVLIEILIGLSLGFSLISNVNLSSTLNLDVNFVIPIIGFVLWTLNLFIFERHAMALRVFYPFVFLSNIFTEDTPNSLFIPALLIVVLSVATLTKPPRNREIRYA
jgi:ABC-type dipeptide/oligopeptide/nickel transport system permease subunit